MDATSRLRQSVRPVTEVVQFSTDLGILVRVNYATKIVDTPNFTTKVSKMMLYALIINVCLSSSGQCHGVSPEVYTDMTACILEVKHQRETLYKGNEALVYCEAIEEDQ